MKRKTILILTILFLFIVAVGITISELTKSRPTVKTYQISEENLTLTYSYTGDNNWEYTVTGETPTPCYNVSTEAIIMESYPEQVKIRVTIVKDTTVEICTTVIEKYNYTGTFKASSEARVSLSVENLK